MKKHDSQDAKFSSLYNTCVASLFNSKDAEKLSSHVDSRFFGTKDFTNIYKFECSRLSKKSNPCL